MKNFKHYFAKVDKGLSEAVITAIFMVAGVIAATILMFGGRGMAQTIRTEETTQASSYIQNLE